MASIILLERVLAKFDLFGRYISTFIFLVFLVVVTDNMYFANYVFVTQEVGYRCKDNNVTCTNSSACNEWIYDDPSSFVAEFHLACKDWKRTLIGSMESTGYTFGLVLIGCLSDRFGRRNMIIVTGVLGGICGVIKSFVTHYWIYCFLSFLESAIGNSNSQAFLLSIEMVDKKKMLLGSLMTGFGVSVGGILLAFSSWLIPYWRNYLRVIYTPALFYVGYICLLDESPRWLLNKGRKNDAIKVITKIAKTDKVPIDVNELQSLTGEDTEESTNYVHVLKKTFSSITLVKRFLLCLIWWLTSIFVSTGIMISSVSLEGNQYLNFALVAFMQVPAFTLATYIMRRYKRKKPMLVCFLMISNLCAIEPFVPTNVSWISLVLYMASSMLCAMELSIIFVYTSELFPTGTRNSMLSLCAAVGFIGAIAAPQTPLLVKYWPGLPSMTYAAASLVAGLATFFVPDVGNEALPDTVEEAEGIGAILLEN